MHITFVYPDFVATRQRQKSNRFHITAGGWYSEGLASLSAVLKNEGHRVSLIHLTQPVKEREFKKS